MGIHVEYQVSRVEGRGVEGSTAMPRTLLLEQICSPNDKPCTETSGLVLQLQSDPKFVMNNNVSMIDLRVVAVLVVTKICTGMFPITDQTRSLV